MDVLSDRSLMLSSSTGERLELTWPRSWQMLQDVKAPVSSGSQSSRVRAVVEHGGSIIFPYLRSLDPSWIHSYYCLYRSFAVIIGHLPYVGRKNFPCFHVPSESVLEAVSTRMTWQVVASAVTLDVDPHFVSHPLPASQLQLPDHLQSAPILLEQFMHFFWLLIILRKLF